MCPHFGTLNIINFTFAINGKLMVLGVPILKHIRVNIKIHNQRNSGKGKMTMEILKSFLQHLIGSNFSKFQRFPVSCCCL